MLAIQSDIAPFDRCKMDVVLTTITFAFAIHRRPGLGIIGHLYLIALTIGAFPQ